MSEENKVEEVVEPVIEKTEEQLKAEAEQAHVKERQELIKNSIKGLVETLFSDPADYSVDELGWASDAFTQWLKIRTTATKEHEEFASVNQAAQDKFYSTKVKSLTAISNEKSAEETKA